MPVTIEAAHEADAAASARIHLEAMDYNLLLHSQFPNAEALAWLQDFLEKDTTEHINGEGKRMLVARTEGEAEPAAFVKWSIYGGEEPNAEDFAWPDFCRAEYLDSYGELTANTRKKVLGQAPHYRKCDPVGCSLAEMSCHVVRRAKPSFPPSRLGKRTVAAWRNSLLTRHHLDVTFLCTKPSFGGRGAATALLREVQRQAAACGSVVVLESTMSAVTFYERLGFQDSAHIEMKLPARGRTEPTEIYEEKCMVWRHAAGTDDPSYVKET